MEQRPRDAVKGSGMPSAVTHDERAIHAVIEEDDTVAGNIRHAQGVVDEDSLLLCSEVSNREYRPVTLPYGDSVTVRSKSVAPKETMTILVFVESPVLKVAAGLDGEEPSVVAKCGRMHHIILVVLWETSLTLVAPLPVSVDDAEDFPLPVADQAELASRVDHGRLYPIHPA